MVDRVSLMPNFEQPDVLILPLNIMIVVLDTGENISNVKSYVPKRAVQ